MFDDLFPKTSHKFDMSPPTARQFADMVGNNSSYHTWSQWVLSCELMTRLASFHGDGNLWEVQRFYARVSYLRGEFAMANKQRKQDPIPDSSKAEWRGFLDFRLTEDELLELDQWKPKPVDLWAEQDELVKAGYRLTLTYNSKTHLASCTMIDDSNMRPTGGWAISSADTDGASAFKMAIFKHLKLERSWIALLDKPQALGRRG